MKTTVAMVANFDEETKRETWRFIHCTSLSEARDVAKKWSLNFPKSLIQIGKGHADGHTGDFFRELNPFELWENGKGMECLSNCVWSKGEPIKMLPNNR